MKKILLAGSLTGAIQAVYDALDEKYKVLISATNYKTIHGMCKIAKPDMVILFQAQLGEFAADVFSGLKNEHEDLPVLVICNDRDWYDIRSDCPEPQFHKMIRPVNNTELMKFVLETLATDLGEEASSESASAASSKVTADDGQIKVLAVDDNPIILRNVQQMLGKDYEVFFATSAEKALDMIMRVTPDLILLDIEMPGMSGIDAFKKFRERKNTADKPIVFLTGASDVKTVMEVSALKPSGYLLKPLDKNQLHEMVENALS